MVNFVPVIYPEKVFDYKCSNNIPSKSFKQVRVRDKMEPHWQTGRGTTNTSVPLKILPKSIKAMYPK